MNKDRYRCGYGYGCGCGCEKGGEELYLGRNLQYFKNPLYTLASFLEVFFFLFAHLREGEELAKFEIFKKGEEKEKKKER